MLDLLLGLLVGSLALVLGLGVVLLGKDCYGEESFINDCNREYIGMPREEIVIVNGCRVIIKYADKENPEALNEMRALLEKQRMIPKSPSKFDDDESI